MARRKKARHQRDTTMVFLALASIVMFALLAVTLEPVGQFASTGAPTSSVDAVRTPQTARQDESINVVSGRFIIKFKEKGATTVVDATNVLNDIASKNALLGGRDVLTEQQVRHVFGDDSCTKHCSLKKTLGMDRVFVISVPATATDETMMLMNEYAHDGRIEYAEPVYAVHETIAPNDLSYPLQWHHNQASDHDIDSPEAWDIGTGSSSTVIAFLDTGFDYHRQNDLGSKYWQNLGEDANGNGYVYYFNGVQWVYNGGTGGDINGVDDDGNGLIDDFIGWNYYNQNNDIAGTDHGTWTAGTAAAATNNALQVAGVCWQCKIMALRVGESSNVEAGLYYAADEGADVISMSIVTGPSQTLHTAVQYAAALNIPMVAAVNNNNVNTLQYPAAYPEVIAVAATNQDDQRWVESASVGSNYGSWVDVAAPGKAILTTTYNNQVIAVDGTSLSTPIVSGIVGLVKSRHPEFSNDQIMTLIHTAIDPLVSDVYVGTGRINARTAQQYNTIPVALLASSIDDITVYRFNLTLDINGTASGPAFQRYTIEYGFGIYPGQWTPLTESTAAVVNGRLMRLDTSLLPQAGNYTIRLTVYDTGGTAAIDLATFFFAKDIVLVTQGSPQSPALGNVRDIPRELRTGEYATFLSHYNANAQADYAAMAGGTVSGAAITPGFISNGLAIDSNADVVTYPAGSNLPWNEGTVEFWIRPAWNPATSTSRYTFFDLDDVLVTGNSLRIGRWYNDNIPPYSHGYLYASASAANGGGCSGFWEANTAGTSAIKREPAVSRSWLPNTWHHIAVTWRTTPTSELLLYADGELVATKTASVPCPGTALPASFRIGNDMSLFASQTQMDATIDELWMSSVKQSAAEILNDYHRGLGTGDGQEIVVSSEYSISVIDKDGTMLPNWPQQVSGATAPALADIDSDGSLEIVVSGLGQVYAWNGDGSPVPGWPVSRNGYQSSPPVIADIDSDRMFDIAVATTINPGHEYDPEFGTPADPGYSYIYVWRGDGTPLQGWPVSMVGTTVAAPALGDINGNGLLDIVATTKSTYTTEKNVSVFNSNTIGAAGWPQPYGSSSSSPALADIDNDGRLEIILASFVSGSQLVVLNHDGSFAAGWPQAIPSSDTSPAIGDIDNNGDLEIITSARNNITAWNGDGSPVPGWSQTIGGTYNSPPVLADIDSDNRLEIIVGSIDTMVYAWNDDGSPAAGWPRQANGGVYASPSVGDVDNDGTVEIIVPSVAIGGGSILVWETAGPANQNNGWPTFHHDSQRTGLYGTACGRWLDGQCSASKPSFCSNGVIVQRCQVCGCSSGSCQPSGLCKGTGKPRPIVNG